MKKLFTCFSFVLFTLFMFTTAVAQTPQQIVRLIESNRNDYYFGHGYDEDYDKALQSSKANLLSDISVYIKANTVGVVSTEMGVSMEERINTYTHMTQLRDVETVVQEENGRFHVFSYLTKDAVGRMFAERKQKMFDYFEEARRSEQKLMMTDALQFYYWSLLILRTLPDDATVTFTDDDGQKQKLLLWLNKHIPALLEDINFAVVDITGDDHWKQVEVAVTYHGRPVANCDYKYWTGRGFSQPVRAKDGRGIAEISTVPAQLQFYVEYVFENEAQNIDPELRDIVQMEGKPVWKNNMHVVKTDMSQPLQKVAVSTPVNQPIATHTISFSALSKSRADSCTLIMNRVKSAVKAKNYAAVTSLFTSDGWELFNKMMTNGKATVIRDPQWKFLQTKDAILCRTLPLSLSYPRSGKTVVENVEFRMDPKTLKINSISYMLNQEAEDDIMDANKKWDNNSRVQIMQFLQNYQTAYALKRADYLESVFSDDALIIVGSKVRQTANVEHQIRLADNNLYTLVKKSKSEYMADLRRVFASAEFINLQLKDNEVIKAGKEEIYGIQIRQLYASNNYADQGYLFLVVDLRNPDKPIIHVRTWQPEKDPDFGLFDLSKFTFN